MRPSQLLAAVVALSSVTAATSNVFDSINALVDAKNVFLPRQDNKNDQGSSQDEPSITAAPQTTDQGSGTQQPTATMGDATTTAKISPDKATKTTNKPKVTNFGPDVQPGGIQMVTPNPVMGPQYYKVGDWVTFAWNYTSLSITPSHVDILASCSVNQQTYTISVNHSVQATDTILWDTGAYERDHPNGPNFVSETYTLLIYDSESSVTAAAKPGYLAPFNQFYFGMYTPQPYVNWTDFECANCLKNGAFSIFASGTTKVLFFTFGTTLASFMYFAVAFGIM